MEDFNFKIPFIGAIINYIYDFCTYKKKWNLRLFFEKHKVKNDIHYFSIRCINKTSNNIKITKIYIKEPKEKALLKIGYYTTDNTRGPTLWKVEYEDIAQGILYDKYTNTSLSPTDTKEYRNYMIHDYENGIRNNEATIKIEFQGVKTELYVEYEIKDIKLLFFLKFFLSTIRIVKVIIPI